MLKVALRGLVAHKVRLVATALAVLLGVTFVTGTNVLAASVSKGFDTVFRDVYQNIDTVVRSTVQVRTPFGPQRARVDGAYVPAIAETPGVAAVEGQVEGDLEIGHVVALLVADLVALAADPERLRVGALAGDQVDVDRDAAGECGQQQLDR